MPSIPSPTPKPFTPGQVATFRRHITVSDACWLWTAKVNQKGYGIISIGGRRYRAHRLAYWLEHGVWPGELMVLHTCDNPPCVNPDHLFPGTAQDNHDDKEQKGRNPRGEQRAAAKLTEAQVKDMRRRYQEGSATLRQLHTEIEEVVSISGIYYAVSGRTWQHIS